MHMRLVAHTVLYIHYNNHMLRAPLSQQLCSGVYVPQKQQQQPQQYL